MYSCRPCELQISDFENAAVCCFVVLLTRSILTYKWNLLMPISKVDENMKRAQKRDAVRTQRFWWRKDIFTPCSDDKVKKTAIVLKKWEDTIHSPLQYPTGTGDDGDEYR